MTEFKKQKKPRIPKKITPSYLNNYALFYLERFSSSSKNLKRILMRRVKKSVAHHGEPSVEDASKMIDDVVVKLIELKYINDDLYARDRTTSFRRAGNSARQISAKLYAKGVDNEKIETAIKTVDKELGLQENPELMAAIRYAQRRNLGPYRRPRLNQDVEVSQEDLDRKDLAKLARAGFSFDVAKKALEEKREKLYF